MLIADRAALLALSAVSLVSAQANSNSTFKIDPSEVDPIDRTNWCIIEKESCSTLCETVIVNTCDHETLDFSCECEGNSYPDLNKFRHTIPSFVCNQLYVKCYRASTGADDLNNCMATYKCGTEDVNYHEGEGATWTISPSSTSASAAPSSSTSEAAAAIPTAHSQHTGNSVAAVALGLLAYAL